MCDELIELIKTHTNCELSAILNTRQNAEILSSKLTDLIVENQENKAKFKKCIMFIHNLSRAHSKSHCVRKENITVYLKHLPIASKEKFNDDFYVQKPHLKEEINAFYVQQELRKKARFNRKAFMNLQMQQSLPPGFHCSTLQTDNSTQPYQLQATTRFGSQVVNQCHKQRVAAVKFAVAVINLNRNFAVVLGNVLSQLCAFETLIQCEKDFLKWLLVEGKFSAKEIIDKFPYLLEEELIDIAIKYYEKDLDVPKTMQKIAWIKNGDVDLKKVAFDIIQSLFVMGDYDCELLNVFTSLID